MSRRAVLLTLSLSAALLTIVRGDDMAFVEVSMSGEMAVGFLNFSVPSKAGVAGFFEESPMLPHDFLSTSSLNTTLQAVLKAAAVGSSGIASMVARTEREMLPLFAALPKLAGTGNGTTAALATGAARYMLHRFFRRKHGWSLKGLAPAGSSALMMQYNAGGFGGDVKQISKYMLPAYLLDFFVRAEAPHQGIALRNLSLIVVIVERLVRIDMQEKLYSVYRTLQVPISGERSKEEVSSILKTFLLTYAFGTNLEVSTKRAVEDAREFLNSGHAAWSKIHSFLDDLLHASTSPVVDFLGTLRLLEEFADSYANWLNRDCSKAKSALAASPSLDRGRVLLSGLPLPDEGTRPLFTGQVEDMRVLGVLEDSAEGAVATDEGPRLLAANYLLSQAFCLSTASVYTICCISECENLLEQVERIIAAPIARSEEVIAALVEASPALRAAGLDAGSLQEQAGDPADGLVRLHGRSFAGWLHSVLPLECPAPGNTAQHDPKTPDEWMTKPDMDVNQLMNIEVQHDISLSAFIAMGRAPGTRDEQPSDRLLKVLPIVALYQEDVELEVLGVNDGTTLRHVMLFVCMCGASWATISALIDSYSGFRRQAEGKAAKDSFV